MRTFEEKAGGGRWFTLRRDVTAARRILRMLIGYFTHGARVRAAYRRKEAAGETYWVDEDAG